MKLADIRKQFPEYDDLSDEDILNEIETEEGESIDLVTPALYDIEEGIERLCKSVQAIQIPDNSASVLVMMKQIKNQLKTLETAIKAIDINVTLPAPIVNVPKIEIPKYEPIVSEQLKEWKFDIIRDRNGYIAEVVARA